MHGLNFKPGLKAVWLTPHGFTAPAQEIDPSTVTAAGFDVLGSFDDNGTYLLQVINPDGAKSDYFPIRIGTPGPSSPLISSHAPNPSPPAAMCARSSCRVETSSPGSARP